MINLNEAIQRIKKAGSTNVRAVPMPGKNVNEDHQIEIKEGNTWLPIVDGIPRSAAMDIINQATNRTILG